MQPRQLDSSSKSTTQPTIVWLTRRIRRVGAWIKVLILISHQRPKLPQTEHKKSIMDRLSSMASFSRIMLASNRCTPQIWPKRSWKRPDLCNRNWSKANAHRSSSWPFTKQKASPTSSTVSSVSAPKRTKLFKSSTSSGHFVKVAKSTELWSVSVSRKTTWKRSHTRFSAATTQRKSWMATMVSKSLRITWPISSHGHSSDKACSTTENIPRTSHTRGTQHSSILAPRNSPCHHQYLNRCRRHGNKTSQTSSASQSTPSVTFLTRAPMSYRNWSQLHSNSATTFSKSTQKSTYKRHAKTPASSWSTRRTRPKPKNQTSTSSATSSWSTSTRSTTSTKTRYLSASTRIPKVKYKCSVRASCKTGNEYD